MSTDQSLPSFLPGNLKAKSRSEYAGPCPACGGNDRFVVILDRQRTGGIRWFCRNCKPPEAGKAFDAIDLLKHWKGMDYAEAWDYLGLQRGSRRHMPVSWQPNKTYKPNKSECSVCYGQQTFLSSATLQWQPPNQRWRKTAAEFLEHCQRDFALDWGIADEKLVRTDAYLAIYNRYLTFDGCLQTGIGYNERQMYVPRSRFGLAGNGEVSLPPGIVIAHRRASGIVGLTIRLTEPRGKQRFHQVAHDGSKFPFLAGEKGQPVIICEAAIDAALAYERSRENGVPMAVVGLCGAHKLQFDQEAIEFIKSAPKLFINYDRDEAGQQAALYIQRTFPNAIFAPTFQAKDLGEMEDNYFQRGSSININNWIAFTLART